MKTTHNTDTIHKLPTAHVHVSPLNSRQPTVKEVTDAGLVKSMQEKGQTTPGIGRWHKTKKGHVELGAGSRRRVAAEAAGISTYDVIIRAMNDDAFEELILLENLQREDPSPKEEAIVVQRLVARGVRSAEQISAVVGKSKTWADRRLQLLKVTTKLLKEWHGGELAHYSVDMMELLGSLPVETQESFFNGNRLEYHLAQKNTRKELTEHLQKNVLCSLNVPWLDDTLTFVKGCGPGCSKDSSKQSALFDFGGKKSCGTCLNPACFFARKAKWNEAEFQRLDGGEDLPIVTDGYHFDNYTKFEIAGRKIAPARVFHEALLTESAMKQPKLVAAAKKVLLVTDAGALSIAYLKPMAKGANATLSTKLASPNEKLKARKNILTGKRWELVRLELVEVLAKTPATGCTEDVFDLVTNFGLPWRHNSNGNDDWKAYDDRKTKGFAIDKGYDQEDEVYRERMDALWSGLRSIFLDRLKPGGNVGSMNFLPDLKRIGALIKFPYEDKKLAADLKILPPKSWGSVDVHTLIPDGAKAVPRTIEDTHAKKTQRAA